MSSPVTQVSSPLIHMSSPMTHMSSPMTHMSSPVTPMSSPVTHMSSPVTNMSSPVTNMSSPVIQTTEEENLQDRMNPECYLELWDEKWNESRLYRSVCTRKYVSLEENESLDKSKEEKRAKRKQKYKKYKKNVRKALSYSWKCLLLGLQNCTAGYYAPNISGTFSEIRPNYL